jgi:hypothetical protein
MSAVGFEQVPLPTYLRAANRVAALAGSDASFFAPERIFADAARHAGLPEQFPEHVSEAVEVLCRSLRDEADLHWFGRSLQHNLLVTGLSAFLRVEKAFADDPTLENEPLVPPLIVTGLPRSGTTFLHRLLAAEPEATAVSLLQHTHPLPYKPLDYRWIEVGARFKPWRAAGAAYQMDAMHYVRPSLPDECNFGMRLAGRSMIYWAMAPAYSYIRWLLDQDLRETYQLYRKVLILHQRCAPGRRITLKCPHHLAWLPALQEALPEAMIVQTHRDPIETIPSECKLILSLQGITTRSLDWRRTVEGNVHKVRTFAERAVSAADAPQGDKIKHVDYRMLVADPLETVKEIHSHFGLPFTAAHDEALSQFAAGNRQHKHGQNTYSVEQFGHTTSGLAADFAAYRARFLDNGGDIRGAG